MIDEFNNDEEARGNYLLVQFLEESPK